MAKVLVADLVIHEREVEIPDQCPLCGATLRHGEHRATLLKLKLASEVYYAAKTEQAVTVHERDEGALWEHASSGTPLAYACLSCEAVLAEGESRLVKVGGEMVTP